MPKPKDSFLLFGPRGTGKSTLLRQWFPDAQWFDLLNQQEMFNIMRSPSYFSESIKNLKRMDWVVVDEVQKVPALLDEVHRLMETEGIRFALSGSSARKLKRGGANLLAGRALVYRLFPFSLKEIGPFQNMDSIFRYGTLPKVFLESDDKMKRERLRAYVTTYLAEEIKAEAVLRRLESFTRFITMAALANGQMTNLSNIARDAGIPRSTVTSYFQILEDTLIGTFLPAWQAKLRMREVAHSKFYFFDLGAVRAIMDRLDDNPTPEEKGILFETLIFNELRAALEHQRLGGQLSYWRTKDGVEVDFVYQRGRTMTAIEVKSSDVWRPDFGRGLQVFKENWKGPVQCVGVYLGARTLRQSFGTVFPLKEFVEKLHDGQFFNLKT